MCSSLSVACGFVFGDPYSPLQFAVKNLQQKRLELEHLDPRSLQPFYQTYLTLEQAPKIGHPLPAAPQLLEFPLQWDIFFMLLHLTVVFVPVLQVMKQNCGFPVQLQFSSGRVHSSLS